MKKIFLIILLTLVISIITSVCILPTENVYADTPSDILNNIGSGDTANVNTGNLTTMAGKILGIIQIASAIAAVILIAVFGFRFILGSAQEKSDYMKSFIPLIIGVVVVFSASSIAKLIFNVADSSKDTKTSSQRYVSNCSQNKIINNIT